MKSSQRKICSAVALIFSAMGASAAMAATPNLIGGGSSLVSPSINAEISGFPAADGTMQYFTTNSTTGQTAFLTNNASLYNSGTVTVTGTVDFGNSDAALLAAQISSYDSSTLGTVGGPLVQIPFVTTPITIPLTNAPTGTGPTLTSLVTDTTPTVALNDNDLCGIFSGKLTNWNQIINPDTGATYSLSRAITVVYRSDGSGTSDLLTRHLAAVCSTATNSNVTFAETTTFANNFLPGTPPSNFIGESGSGAVAAELVSLRAASTAAVSYLSPDFTNTLLAPSSSSANSNQLSVASLLNSLLPVVSGAPANANDVVPTGANAATAVGAFSAPSTAAQVADQTQWVPNSANPSTGYPVSGTTNIIVSQCYANPGATSPSPAAALLDFLTLHYESTTNAGIIAGNGFAVLPTNWLNAVKSNLLTNGGTFKANIQNATFCSTHAGR